MTALEHRTLYLLRKFGGTSKKWRLSQAMARTKTADRERTLTALENLELIGCTRTSPTKKGGPGGLVYWLTDAGNEAVTYLIESGAMRRPVDDDA